MTYLQRISRGLAPQPAPLPGTNQEKDREVDVFLTLTESETWIGNIHPSQALAEYRRASAIDARLMTTPQLIADVSRGAL